MIAFTDTAYEGVPHENSSSTPRCSSWRAALFLHVRSGAGPHAAATASRHSKVNQRDRNATQPTADQQSNASNDREIASQIRKALVDDKSLSTYGQNIKVIVQNGQVTLRGPVRSEEEKRNIEAIATSIAGTGKVINELEVAPQP